MGSALIRFSPPATHQLCIFREADSQESASFDFGKALSVTLWASIEADTLPTSFSEVRLDHITPVFVKDNESLISQFDFIQVMAEDVRDVFRGKQILTPQVRVSHPIKGRTPEAKDKPASQLHNWERTL